MISNVHFVHVKCAKKYCCSYCYTQDLEYELWLKILDRFVFYKWRMQQGQTVHDCIHVLSPYLQHYHHHMSLSSTVAFADMDCTSVLYQKNAKCSNGATYQYEVPCETQKIHHGNLTFLYNFHTLYINEWSRGTS